MSGVLLVHASISTTTQTQKKKTSSLQRKLSGVCLYTHPLHPPSSCMLLHIVWHYTELRRFFFLCVCFSCSSYQYIDPLGFSVDVQSLSVCPQHHHILSSQPPHLLLSICNENLARDTERGLFKQRTFEKFVLI